ncbi:hypothetical protein RJT34_20704 [Clitoria ternatea]|uniref:Uncharacterized protein n=1 Tax=Clitoria ternatea TaxID=43366 RepID=A0AAN9P5H4_CLITE
MGGGAWPFLVGGAICLVNSVNERDLSLLNSYVEVCDALRCSGPYARYTDVFNESIALADRPGWSYVVWPLLGQTLTPALHVSRSYKVGMEPLADLETVILQGLPKRIIMNDSRQRISWFLHR